MRIQVPSTAPSVPTLGTASELVRYDGLAFLYANPGLMPPFSPVFRRITRLGLQHGPGLFVNSLYQKRQDSIVRGFPQIYRVLREIRVLRVIRVIIGSPAISSLRIENDFMLIQGFQQRSHVIYLRIWH